MLKKSKNLAGYRSENNFAGILSNAAKCFDILAINFVVLPNCFDGPAKLFSDLIAKFLDLQQNCFFSVAAEIRIFFFIFFYTKIFRNEGTYL